MRADIASPPQVPVAMFLLIFRYLCRCDWYLLPSLVTDTCYWYLLLILVTRRLWKCFFLSSGTCAVWLILVTFKNGLRQNWNNLFWHYLQRRAFGVVLKAWGELKVTDDRMQWIPVNQIVFGSFQVAWIGTAIVLHLRHEEVPERRQSDPPSPRPQSASIPVNPFLSGNCNRAPCTWGYSQQQQQQHRHTHTHTHTHIHTHTSARTHTHTHTHTRARARARALCVPRSCQCYCLWLLTVAKT